MPRPAEHPLRDEALLESAIVAPENRLHYENADAVTCAATYAYHLSQTHAFFDGNKRVAAAISEAFLETNGFELVMTNEEIVELFLAIAAGKLSREQIEDTFREKVKRITLLVCNERDRSPLLRN